VRAVVVEVLALEPMAARRYDWRRSLPQAQLLTIDRLLSNPIVTRASLSPAVERRIFLRPPTLPPESPSMERRESRLKTPARMKAVPLPRPNTAYVCRSLEMVCVFRRSADPRASQIWNPFRSKLAAGILGGLETIYMKPGSKVLYLGAASGTSVSHVADIVGPTGAVYAVEFSHRSGRDLINMAVSHLLRLTSAFLHLSIPVANLLQTRRTNVIP